MSPVPDFKVKRTAGQSPVPTVPVTLLLCCCVFPVELLDTSVSTGSLLLSCIELMALRADLDLDLLFCGADGKGISAVACHLCLKILRMDSFSHDLLLFSGCRFLTRSQF